MSKPGITAALTIALAASAVPASAAGAPDLRTTKVQTSSFAHLGGPLPVAVTVAVGAGRGRSTSVRVYLSKDRKRSKDDLRLAGAGRIGRLAKRARREQTTVAAAVPKTFDGDRRYVIACADDPGRLRESSERNNCRAASSAVTIAKAADPARTSQSLIAADLAAGKLSTEKSLLYRVFAIVGDDRLPARYAGDVAADEDHNVFREVADAWPGLSKATRRALRPDLVPPPVRELAATSASRARAAQDPDDPGTCVNDGGKTPWKSVSAAGGKVRINWDPAHPEDGAHVGEFAAAVTTAYARYKQIMGVEPISDASETCYHGKDGALDIYIDDSIRRADGYTIPAGMMSRVTPECDGFASFILVRPTSVSFTMRFVLAHEVFHAFQNVFPEHAGCADGKWLAEASANWAAHTVFPTDDSEHLFESLIHHPYSEPDFYDYDTWPFILWMEKTFGERSIRTAYQQLKTRGSVAAVDNAIGGFRKSYLDFAKHAWNQAPMPTFKEWDRYTAVPLGEHYAPLEPVHLLLAGLPKRTANVPVAINDRAREYHPFTITDDKLREIVFRNPRPGDADFRAGAILTLRSGEVRFDDWSEKKSVRYCRDNPGQEIASLVVVYANSALGTWKNRHRIEDNPTLDLADHCEGLPWHFKVLSASLKTHAIGGRSASSQESLCAVLAGLPIEGQTTFNAATTEADFSLEHDVTQKSGGALAGAITTRGQATFGFDLKGCQGVFTGDPITSCAKAFDRKAGGDGSWAIGFTVAATSKDAENATLTWAIPNPSIGFFDADDTVCDVVEVWHGLEPEKEQQQIPMKQLAGTDPVTLSFSGNDAWTTDNLGNPATLAYDWTYSMTIQRVDETGQPLN